MSFWRGGSEGLYEYKVLLVGTLSYMYALRKLAVTLMSG